MSTTTPKKRCAIYTRKSTEEGLDMEFNSLDAQREACESYPAEKQRILELMIEKVIVNYEFVDIRIRAAGMDSLARELDEQDKRLQGISTNKLEEQAWINA